jgi:hypothetical protein
MSNINILPIDLESEIANATTIKELVLKQLLKDNIISQEIFEEYNNRQIIVVKRKWYHNFFSKLGITSEKDLGNFIYRYVKFD